MKKLFCLIFGMSIGAVVMAQTGPRHDREREKTMKNLREDVRAHEDTKHVVGNDLVHFRFRRAIQEHREVARTHRVIDRDRKIARRQGIDHPVAQARRELHREQERGS
jgi:hypothetical protein